MHKIILISDHPEFSESLTDINIIHATSLVHLDKIVAKHSVESLVMYQSKQTDYKTLSKIRLIKNLHPQLKVIYVLSQHSPSLKTLFALGIDVPLREELGFQKLSEIVQEFLGIQGYQSIEPAQKILSYADLTLNPNTREVYRNMKKIKLRRKEFELLEYLLFNQGIVVSKSQMLEQIWGYSIEIDSKTVDVHISTLRAKLDKDFKHKLIHTVYGAGYKLELIDQ